MATPTRGTIVFDGRALGGMRPHQIGRLGIARTFLVCASAWWCWITAMSVRDQLRLGVLIEVLMETIDRLNREGMTILLVEQDVQVALEHATRAYLLETGRISLEGKADALLADPRVRQAYLGV